MRNIAVDDLVENLDEIIDRIKDGEELTITLTGRPVARLVPLRQRKQYYLPADELLAHPADPGLRDDLRALDAEDHGEWLDPWERAARRARTSSSSDPVT